MPARLLSILGILLSVSCLWAATIVFPGGFDWSRDFISTMLRGPAGPALTLAVGGVLIFCASITPVYVRLARAAEFSRESSAIRIGGIGSIVYTALVVTPMHDVMVTISVPFALLAELALARALYRNREVGFFVAGCLCLALLAGSVTVYYTGLWASLLPWAQRVSFALSAGWLVALDWAFPRGPASDRRHRRLSA